MSKICGVYLLTHIETGMKYVGQSVDIANRWRVHSKGLCTKRLGRTIAHYGWSAFSAEILEECDRVQLNEVEIKWVAHHDCISPKGLNLTSGGCANHYISEETRMKHSIHGLNLSEEARAKISAAHKGKKLSAEQKANLSVLATGRKPKPETREKLRLAGTGRIQSTATKAKRSISSTIANQKPEVRAKISAALTGIQRSAETKAKLSELAKNRVITQETKEKLRITSTGRQRTPESIAKSAAAHTGIKHTPERRAKITAAKAANRLLRQNTAIATTGGLSADFVQRQ